MTGTNPTVSIRLNLDGAPQVEAGLKGAAGAAASLEKSTAGLGAATKLTGMQTAQMSAQLQDLFVQIQAGGSPLTALIQQGSQLSAVFGGFGPAFRAVASLITPTVVGLTAAGAAAAGLGAAFLIGAQESKAFADSLALTGNAAGLTESRFNAMAGAIGTRTLSGVGTAREALQALVASGRLSGDAIQATAGAVAALSRATGEGAGDIAKRFLSIVDNVGEGARKLNEQFNFLTAGQYAYIRSLEDAGRKQEAIAETMRLLEGRAGTTTQNLGYLESAWDGVAKAIGKAWDNLKGLGRTDTVSDQIKVLQAMADAPVRNGGNPLQAEARRAAIREQISLLREVERMENRGAEAAAKRAAEQKAGIQWMEDGNKLLSRQAQYEREIKQARELAETAKISPEKLAERLDAIAGKYKDLGAAARKAGEDQRRLIADGVKLFGDLTAQSSGLSPDFAEKWDLLNAAQRAGAISVDQLTKAQAVLLAQQPLMVKAAADQERASAAVAKMYAEEADALEKLLRAQDEAATASLAGVLGRVKSLEDEAAAAGIAASANVSLGEAVEMLAVARLREAATVAAASGRQDQVNAINAEIEARQKLGRMLTSKEVAAAHQKAADEAVQVWLRASEQVGDAMYDALTGNYASAKRLIESQVIRPIVQAQTQGLQTGITNAITGKTGQNFIGGANMAQSALAFVAYADAAMSAKAGNWGEAIGTAAGYTFAGPVGGMIGKMIGSAVDKVFQGGAGTPHLGGYVQASATGRISDIAAQQGGKQQAETQRAVGLLAQQLVGALNVGSKAFGGQGNNSIRAVFESDGQDPSWALFHLLDSKGVKIAGSFDATGTLAADPKAGFAEFAGMAAASVRDALLAIDLPHWASDALSAIQASDGADALAQTVADIVSAQEAITAFGQQFAGMGGMFERLAGLSSDATNDLAGFAGGIDRLSGNLQGFFQAFYTDAERSAMTLGAIGEQLGGVGLSLPSTREQFRAVVEAQDLTTASGREAYAALLNVAGAFASVVVPAEAAAAAADKLSGEFAGIVATLASGVQSAYATVASTISAEQDRVTGEADKALAILQQQADGVQSTFEALRDSLQGLRSSLQDTIDGITGAMSGDDGREVARAFLESVLVTARAGQAIDTGKVQQAAGKLGQLSTAGFTSRADYLRDAAAAAQLLRDLSGAAAGQIVTARQQMTAELGTIAKQMTGVESERDTMVRVLDAQLNEAKEAAKSLVSIDDGVSSVADAIGQLSQAIGALASASGKASPSTVTGQWQRSGNASVFTAPGGAVGVRNDGSADTLIRGKASEFTATQAVDWVTAQLGAGKARDVYDRAKLEGIDLDTLDALMGWAKGTSAVWATSQGLPAFALGGLHEGGARLVGENGPEIAVTGPERIYSFDQLMQMAGGGRQDEALVAEVKALRVEVSRMREENNAQQIAIANAASLTATIQKRWEGGGLPATRA